jgi:murein DD-endopeptidase MepM/ murein hydrolase activator NlpD
LDLNDREGTVSGAIQVRVWLAVGIFVITVGIATGWFLRNQSFESLSQPDIPSLATQSQPTPANPILATASPAPTSVEYPTPAETPEAKSSSTTPSFVGVLNLIIPVAGIRAQQLIDTFSDARSEGRTHDAIDITAPAGTAVLAAADGEIIKLFQSERGGTTIYQLSADRKLVFYYAHLQGYADGLAPGRYVQQGQVIAYVGDTGNAGTGNFHLHFSIGILADPKRYWEGTNINPYPLLHH